MINLLLSAEKAVIRKEYRLRFAAVILIMFFFVLASILLSFSPAYLTILSKYNGLVFESQNVAEQNRKNNVQDSGNTIQDTNAKIAVMGNATTDTHAWNIFSQILSVIPRGVTLSGMTYQTGVSTTKGNNMPSRLTIHGNAATRESLLAFVGVLKGKSYFSGVDLPISSLISETNLDFTIKINVTSEAGIP